MMSCVLHDLHEPPNERLLTSRMTAPAFYMTIDPFYPTGSVYDA